MFFINRLYFKFRHYFAGHYPKLYELCERRKSIIKFFIAGCFAGGSDLVFLFIMHGIFKWNVVLATSAAFILSFGISFTLQKFWTFRNYNQTRMVGQLFVYMTNALISLFLNGFLMHLLVNKIHIWYLLSQFMVNLSLGFYNFLVYKFIIFRTDKHETDCVPKTTL